MLTHDWKRYKKEVNGVEYNVMKCTRCPVVTYEGRQNDYTNIYCLANIQDERELLLELSKEEKKLNKSNNGEGV